MLPNNCHQYKLNDMVCSSGSMHKVVPKRRLCKKQKIDVTFGEGPSRLVLREKEDFFFKDEESSRALDVVTKDSPLGHVVRSSTQTLNFMCKRCIRSSPCFMHDFMLLHKFTFL